jgi:hypothetical protein
VTDRLTDQEREHHVQRIWRGLEAGSTERLSLSTLEVHMDALRDDLDALTAAAREVLDYENAPSRRALSSLRAVLARLEGTQAGAGAGSPPDKDTA